MKKHLSWLIVIVMVSCLLPVITGCGVGSKSTFHIISGSENETLEPLIEEFEKKHHVDIQLHYKGSVDIMSKLSTDEILEYDAVWPANSIWISMGDTNRITKHTESIMTSPVVFGIKKSIAEELGFVGAEVSVNDILTAVENKQLSFIMTSSTQSNSGATAYLGFLHALAGKQETLTMEDFQNAELKKSVTGLLSGIDRSSGSSGWLKELFLKGDYDAMVNYEALIIETNQELIKEGKEPLYLVYPYDGLGFADSPLGYVNQGDKNKEETFLALQEFLLSEATQEELLAYGRRTGFGIGMDSVDKKVFNPDWGIDTEKVLSSIRMPADDVIREALRLYQVEFKKPSYTVYCIDFSGSMSGDGEDQLKEAMATLLNPETAKQYMLEPSNDEVAVVVLFSDEILASWEVKGNDVQERQELINHIVSADTGGGTEIYHPVIQSMEYLKSIDTEGYFPAVVLMTDGKSNGNFSQHDLEQYIHTTENDIPVFSIMFGNASDEQLDEISELTNGRVFDGKKNLISAFKKAKGYN